MNCIYIYLAVKPVMLAFDVVVRSHWLAIARPVCWLPGVASDPGRVHIGHQLVQSPNSTALTHQLKQIRDLLSGHQRQ